jgi:hypothetical protein
MSPELQSHIAGRGHTAMKGFSEPVPIFTVKWRAAA